MDMIAEKADSFPDRKRVGWIGSGQEQKQQQPVPRLSFKFFSVAFVPCFLWKGRTTLLASPMRQDT